MPPRLSKKALKHIDHELELFRWANPYYHWVGDRNAMATLINLIDGLPIDPPALFLGFEGEKACHFQPISLLKVHLAPTNDTYLIDLLTLRGEAFTTAGAKGRDFKNYLEADSFPKVLFDVRFDSKALFWQYGVRLAGVQDLQLMEWLSKIRPDARTFVGLMKCIDDTDLGLDAAQKRAWKAAKDVRKLFVPRMGGSWSALSNRPLCDAIQRYIAREMSFLPRLWGEFNEWMTPEKWEVLQDESAARIDIPPGSDDEGGNGVWLVDMDFAPW